MAKVSQGRISGLNGMQVHTAAELFAWADHLRAQAIHPDNADDPKWLLRRADRLTALAKAKEKSREHKQHRLR